METDKIFRIGFWSLVAGVVSPYLTVLAFYTVLPPGFMFSIFFGFPSYLVGLILIWLSKKRTMVKVLLTVLPLVGMLLSAFIWGIVVLFTAPGLGAPR
jgi:hypothetical protein